MSSSYSNLQSNYTTESKWHGMPVTGYTLAKRRQIRGSLDNFTSFSWRGVDAWENFGAFILNEKDSLKFFEGPTWTNQYSQPHFSSQVGQLTGMTFKVPSLSFTIGVYWFSEEEYRFLLDWLNPYEINELSFGFAPDYYYQVKLAAISQGTRYILGQENITYFNLPATDNWPGNNNLPQGVQLSKHRYYTEIKLTFELQGPMCAYSKDLISWTFPSTGNYISSGAIATSNSSTISDIEFPIEANIQLKLAGDLVQGYFHDNKFYYDSGHISRITPTADNIYFDISTAKLYEYRNDSYVLVTERERTSEFSLLIQYQNQEYELFNCLFTNLPYDSNLYLNIHYSSEDGFLFWTQGDSRTRLLSSLSTLSTGSRFISNFNTQIFKIPGRFNLGQNNVNAFSFKVLSNDTSLKIVSDHTIITGRPRTNVI